MLGHGSDGAVWGTSRNTALKILAREESYRNEAECYRRLKSRGIRYNGKFAVPFLEGLDDKLLAIEMTIVDPPYLLDFGKVTIDRPPVYFGDRQLMKNAYAEWRERFGRDWHAVASALGYLQTTLGIYYMDPRPAKHLRAQLAR